LLGAGAMRWRSNPKSPGGLTDGVKRRLALTDAALMSLLEGRSNAVSETTSRGGCFGVGRRVHAWAAEIEQEG